MEENLFEKGCLVQLSASVWRAARKIKPEQLSEVPVSHEWLTATKKLVDPDSLKPVNSIVNSARSYLTTMSLPFPIHGMVFAPKEMISRVDSKLEEFKAEFNKTVEEFLDGYPQLRETASVHLGGLFNEMDYPVDVKAKFAFMWRFIILEVPNGKTGILDPEIYEREKDKFIRTMDEARELAVQSLRDEFAGMISRITERFSNGDAKPKVFKNGTVNNLYGFFENFRERNIFQDDQLAELVDKAKAILGNESAESIRSNEQVKEQIRTGMEGVEKAMAEILSMPRRKIIMN
jgi:hypothetical protein